MFTIKKATLADIEVIRTLAAQTFPATYQHILTPEQIDYMMDWMYSSESLRNQMEKEHHIYYIAYEECEPAGYVSIQQEDTDLFHLQKIYVLPYFQKYKLGRQLFQQAIKGIKAALIIVLVFMTRPKQIPISRTICTRTTGK